MLKSIIGLIAGLFGTVGGVVLLLSGSLGWLYWMWISIQLGSFLMFFFGFLGPLAFIAGVLGLWSFFFGIPLWLLHMVK